MIRTTWEVTLTKKAKKQRKALYKNLDITFRLLVNDLVKMGPCPGKHWQNYGKLRGRRQSDHRHCHLCKGNPTYVACWAVYTKTREIEVYYVGTHENAPY